MSYGKLIFGVLLIGVGGVLLATHLGYVPAATGPWLLQYWPVLLVAIGLAFLANAIESPFLGWVAVIGIIGGLAYGAWWAHEHGAPSRPTVETLFNLDRPRVESLTLRTRTLGGVFTLGEGGGARRLRVEVIGAGDKAAERPLYTPTKAGALLEWPPPGTPGTRIIEAPLGARLHVRAPDRMPVRLESRCLFSTARVDLSRMRPDRCGFEAVASSIRLDLRSPARPAAVRVKGFLSTTEVLLPASGPVRIEFTSRFTTSSLPEDFMEHATGRDKSGAKFWTSEGSGTPLLIRIDGPLMHLKVTRETAKAV